MPNIYVTEETKSLLDKVAEMEKRTIDGQINYMCGQKVKELFPLKTCDGTPILHDENSMSR